MEEICQYVTSSSVRADIVTRLATEKQETSKLIETIGASDSSVYSALSDLERRGVIQECDGGWVLTGCGEIVADTAMHRDATESFLARDPEYWERRRAGVLPDRFRYRLPEIGEYEIVRAEVPAVNRKENILLEKIQSAESVQILSRIYMKQYEEATPDSESSQVMLTPEIIDQLVDQVSAGRREHVFTVSNPRYRVRSVDFGFVCTSDSICLIIPHQTKNRSSTMLVSETAEAIQWGEELYDYLWNDAEPLDDYLETRGLGNLAPGKANS